MRRRILDSYVSRSREELLSSKLSLLAFVLLATSLSLAIEHVPSIEEELNSQAFATPGSGNAYASRPISTCGTTGISSKGHHGMGNCPFNFDLSLSQKNLVQVQGTNSSVQLSVTLTSGVSSPVALSAQGVPARTMILFTPASAKPSFVSTMMIAARTGTPLGQYNVTIVATGQGVVRSEILSLLIVPIVHDLAVVSAKVAGTATIGSIVLINATVANYGSGSETFDLRAYANTSLVAELSRLNLAPSAVFAGMLSWNTTGLLPGTYTVLVSVPPVRGQLNLLDTSRDAGQILLNQTPGIGPSPSPAASAGTREFPYWRQLAILAAIAEVATVFLFVLLRRRRVQPETTQ